MNSTNQNTGQRGLFSNSRDSYAREHQAHGRFWYLGVMFSEPEGVRLVVPMSASKEECLRNLSRVATTSINQAIVSGTQAELETFVHSVDKLTSGLSNTDEHTVFFNTLNNMFTSLSYEEHVTEATGGLLLASPSKGKYPANLSTEARKLWDNIIDSDLYKRNTQGRTGVQKYAILTKMVLDKASRQAVTPFARSKSAFSTSELTKQYAEIRSRGQSLEQQVCKNLWFRNLVESLDRGVWKFLKVDYVDSRFAIVLETRWGCVTDDPKKIVRHLVNREGFKHNDSGSGWILKASNSCYLNIRIKKFPEISVRMILLFSKDKLVNGLGLTGKNKHELLDQFEQVARNYARSRKFTKFDPVEYAHASTYVYSRFGD